MTRRHPDQTDPRIRVSPEDQYLLAESFWSITERHGNLYARRSVRQSDGSYVREYLHHAVKGQPPKGSHVDHRDGDGLNNQRGNLRFATPAQNQANQQRPLKGKRFKGVHPSRLPGRKPWVAQITVNYRTVHLGYFDTEEEAAHAYDQVARNQWGAFAHLNFPKESKCPSPLRSPENR